MSYYQQQKTGLCSVWGMRQTLSLSRMLGKILGRNIHCPLITRQKIKKQVK